MRRREFIKHLGVGALTIPALSIRDLACSAKARRPNVLFVCIDDLNDWVGVLGGHPQVQTPHIDELARSGVLFTNAHCDVPECRASRVATLTGWRPSRSGFYAGSVQSLRERLPDVITLPQLFARDGYRVSGSGKIFHDADPASWPEYYPSKEDPIPSEPMPRAGLTRVAHHNRSLWSRVAWGAADVPESQLTDPQIVAFAADQMRLPSQQPFFVAAGLVRPHIPWLVPQAYFDLYPLDQVIVPEIRPDDLDDVPRIAQDDLPTWDIIRDSGNERAVVRGYLASISFADAMVGRLVEALDESGHRDDTIIVLWSDNGLQMGEKSHAFKSRLWEQSTRVPLVIVAPGITRPGGACSRPVNLVDILPTLVELCGLETLQEPSGISLVPQLIDPATRRVHPALIAGTRGNDAIRSDDWRYIRYSDGSEELYDHRVDPRERTNLARNPAHAAQKAELARWLPR